MKLAIMQPYLFPYLGYFQLIAAVEKFVILDDVNFINKGWINRNRILINGKPSIFTLPLEQASQNKLIKDIQVSKDQKWTHKFLKSLEMSYKKSTYFEVVFPLIKKSISIEDMGISDMVHNSLLNICSYLNVNTEIIPHSSVYQTDGLMGQEKILEICIQAGATHYINPVGGQDLYRKEKFEETGIQISFLSPDLKPYTQNSVEFVEGLSIIDVLMHNSPEQIREHLGYYKLI